MQRIRNCRLNLPLILLPAMEGEIFNKISLSWIKKLICNQVWKLSSEFIACFVSPEDYLQQVKVTKPLMVVFG